MTGSAQPEFLSPPFSSRPWYDGTRVKAPGAIEKPIFDRLTPLGACRPSFLLEARSRNTGEVRRIVVEATGMMSDEARPSKAAALRRLTQIAPVVALTPNDLKTGHAGSILLEALSD